MKRRMLITLSSEAGGFLLSTEQREIATVFADSREEAIGIMLVHGWMEGGCSHHYDVEDLEEEVNAIAEKIADFAFDKDLVGFHEDLVRKGIFKGINLNVLARRFLSLEAMRFEGKAPEIRFRAFKRGSSAWGTAHGQHRHVTMRLPPKASRESAVETLLHELVHISCPLDEYHGELFCRRLIACAREAFGLDLDTAALLGLKPNKTATLRAYLIDAKIVEAMSFSKIGDALRADPECAFEPKPEQNEEEIEARRAAEREEKRKARFAHAVAKLAEWERKTAAAKKRAAGWRSKVRRYERIAAKKQSK